MNHKNFKPLLYGIADFGPASIDIFLKVYLLLYFNVILGLSPSLTSLAIGLGVLWDALIDPWIGVYSDHYYQINGHRKFLIFSSVVLSAFLFFIIWRIPNLGQTETFLFLFFISSLLNSTLSLFSVPYMAIANDLEPDNEKRKVWTGWRLAFLNLGSFLGIAVPAYFLTQNVATAPQEASLPYKQATAVLSLLMVFGCLTSLYFVYRKQNFVVHTGVVHKKIKLLSLIKDKKFLRMITSYFVVNCGLGLNSALALYYYKDYLVFTQKQTQTILVGFLFVFTLSIPFWVYLTRYFDKQKLIFTGAFLLGVMTVICFPNFRGVEFFYIFMVASVIGGVLVGVAVVLEIYLSDFLKEKELETARSVSGQYLGVWKMSSKISRAVAIALAGPILEMATDKQLLANYFGWGVGLFFILAALVIAVPIRKN